MILIFCSLKLLGEGLRVPQGEARVLRGLSGGLQEVSGASPVFWGWGSKGCFGDGDSVGQLIEKVLLL